MTLPINLPSVFKPEQVAELKRLCEASIPRDMPPEKMNSSDMRTTLTNVPGGEEVVRRMLELFCEAGCVGMAQKLFKGEVAFLLPQCAYRYHQPQTYNSQLPFHLDAAFLGADAMTFTFWVPLVDVGETAPSLTFLRPGIDNRPFIEAWVNRARTRQMPYFDGNEIAEVYGEAAETLFVSPVLPAGSVSIFHHMTPHATQAMPEGGNYRISVDFRIGARNSLPNQYTERNLPIAVASQVNGTWRVEIGNVNDLTIPA